MAAARGVQRGGNLLLVERLSAGKRVSGGKGGKTCN